MMLTVLVLTLCNGVMCVEKRPFDPMPVQFCAIQGQALAADWIRHNMPTFRLDRWECGAGPRRSAT